MTHPGHCTHCGLWLGLSVEGSGKIESDEEEWAWQNWVLKIIEDLRVASVNSDDISWGRISINFATYLEVKGEAARLSRLLGVTELLISRWKRFEMTPSFQKVLEICYAAGISPLQLMSDYATMRNAIQSISEHPSRRPAHHRLQSVDRVEVREYLQAVLDGRRPSRAICQIERDFGLGHRTIYKIFPLESSLVSKQHLAQRAQAWRQHIVRTCEEVRLIASALHAQGVYPSSHRVGSQLSKPNMMRIPDVRDAWQAALRELGLKE
jgi:hypothetical protein